jgi:hypothetical protein
MLGRSLIDPLSIGQSKKAHFHSRKISMDRKVSENIFVKS